MQTMASDGVSLLANNRGNPVFLRLAAASLATLLTPPNSNAGLT